MAINIDYLVRFKLSYIKEDIAEALRTGKEVGAKTEVNTSLFGRWELSCVFFPKRMELGLLLINGDGQTIKQMVEIKEEDSNLNNGSKVYYFLCRGHKCRTLYSNGTGFYPRQVFRHCYQQQKLSHRDRIVRPKKEPYRAYGKEFYRGKLTPYGKRVRSYNRYEERREEEIIKGMLRFFGNRIYEQQ